ncbi:MAG: 3-deoxy-manno-octulosonate cytidylyltransferase [Novosphingobium sp.]|nr:3-deoxy-manno-octulosonate cytidylyltransferase [Novosphingobium sp.]
MDRVAERNSFAALALDEDIGTSVDAGTALRSLVIIPSREGSVRFPGKPLAPLTSRQGVTRPLVEWTWRAALRAADPADVVIATDSARIADAVTAFGGQVVMTSPDALNGTERCAEAYALLGRKADVVVNWQGDNPLVPPGYLAALLAAFTDPSVQLATPFARCDPAMSARLRSDYAEGRIGGTCVTARCDGTAIAFSKAPIPFGAARLNLHIGLYAYRPEALAAYAALPVSQLELDEALEQLRLLDAGLPVHLVEVALPQGGLWEVNNPDDVALVEALLYTNLH